MKETKKLQKNGSFEVSDFEHQAVEQLKSGMDVVDVFKPMLQHILNQVLLGEQDAFLSHPPNAKSVDGNYRNGSNKKTVQSSIGPVELTIPRDRNGDFEPTLIKKHERKLGNSIENKVLSLYALGMSYQAISDHLDELYGLDLSDAQLSAITDKIWPTVCEWRNRPLEEVYPFVYLDALFFKVRDEGKVVSRAVYIVLGVNQSGHKEILGMYVCETEGARFWLSVLTDLNTRGVKDILIACIDNLKGFAEAIESIFPETKVQLCVIHQIRNSLKYIASKDQKEFMNDLKTVYKASSREVAEENLLWLSEKWDGKYHAVIKSWNSNWERLATYFEYSKEIRKMIYTTNIIEGLNRQIRKVTKTKGAFVSEKALLKQLFLIFDKLSDKWNQPIQNWSLTLSQLSIIFEDRLKLDLCI